MDLMPKTNDEWKQKLTPEQYAVLREKATERPGSSPLLNEDAKGVFRCAGCGTKLFRSEDKFESTTPGLIGWPGFTTAAAGDRIKLQPDESDGMHRTEVICANCGGHLGHLFDDPSTPGGKHYCINGCTLNFKKSDEPAK